MSQVIDRVRNGVDTEQLYGTLDAIKAQPELGALPVPRQQPLDRRRAQPHRRSRASTAPARRTPRASRRSCSTPASRRSCSAPTPAPNPAEALLHALAACLTTSLVYVAAARKVRLTEVESTLEGDMDVRGALGLSDEVRNGFTQHPRHFRVKGDAPRGEAARGRRARPGALGRVRHGHQRRARSTSTSSPAERRTAAGHVPGRPPSNGDHML